MWLQVYVIALEDIELSHKLEYFSPENNWKRYKEQVKKNPNDFILVPQPASICVVDGKITFEY